MTASVSPAYNRLIISHDFLVRLCRQKGRTLLYLLNSDRELDAPAGLDPGLDEGTDGVDEEEHDEGENETEEEVEAGMSQLSTDGFDAHLSDGSRLLEGSDRTVLVVTTDLAPFVSRVDYGVLQANVRLIQRNTSG
jgi:hypothetical protein